MKREQVIYLGKKKKTDGGGRERERKAERLYLDLI